LACAAATACGVSAGPLFDLPVAGPLPTYETGLSQLQRLFKLRAAGFIFACRERGPATAQRPRGPWGFVCVPWTQDELVTADHGVATRASVDARAGGRRRPAGGRCYTASCLQSYSAAPIPAITSKAGLRKTCSTLTKTVTSQWRALPARKCIWSIPRTRR
jgi:hypothetical protein